jgi:hypothetical protein
MNRKWTALDFLIGAMEKLSPRTGERQNVLAFIQSCYGGQVRSYDLDLALASLTKLSEEEQHFLITWTLVEKESRSRQNNFQVNGSPALVTAVHRWSDAGSSLLTPSLL